MDKSHSLYQQVSNHFQPLGDIEALVLTSFGLDVFYLERRILPAFFPNLGEGPADQPHQPLYEYLESEQVPISVLYDGNELVSGDAVIESQAAISKDLRWQAHPVVKRSGCFHPKIILALVNDGEQRKIVIGCSSANLTRPGWARNFEACALETINLRAGMKSSLLLDIEQWIDNYGGSFRDSKSLEVIRTAIAAVNPQAVNEQVNTEECNTRLWFGQGGLGLGEWLRTSFADNRIDGKDWRLEILSPYISKDIPQLIFWANSLFSQESHTDAPRILCYCPRDGELVDLDPVVLDNYSKLESVRWAELSGESLKSRFKDEHGNALSRFLHAKVYRFYTEECEILIIGSANATVHGHRDPPHGNDEACLVFTRKPAPGLTLKPWLRSLDRELTADDCKEMPSTAEDNRSDNAMPIVQAQFNWSDKVLSIANQGSRSADIYLRGDSPLCTLKAGVTWEAQLEQEKVDCLFRSPAVRIANSGTNEQAWICLVEEINLHNKPPAPSMERNVEDLIRDWQVGTDQRIAERIAREAMPDDLRASSAFNSPELDEGASQDKLNDLFLAVHRFRRDIEIKLSSDIRENRFVYAQLQSRLFGRGAMSVHYFVEKVILATRPESKTSASMSPIDGYLAVLLIKDALDELTPTILDSKLSDQLAPLKEYIDAKKTDLRAPVLAILGQENSPKEAKRLIQWVEENFRYSFEIKEAS